MVPQFVAEQGARFMRSSTSLPLLLRNDRCSVHLRHEMKVTETQDVRNLGTGKPHGTSVQRSTTSRDMHVSVCDMDTMGLLITGSDSTYSWNLNWFQSSLNGLIALRCGRLYESMDAYGSEAWTHD